jgi:hypothetical protein
MGPGSNHPQYLQAIRFRQIDIQENKIGHPSACGVDKIDPRGVSIVNLGKFEWNTAGSQRFLHQVNIRCVILDN